MPNTNVVSPSAHFGASDTVRHNLTPARREIPLEGFHRKHFPTDSNAYERARQAGKVTYNPRR